jgi:exosome complex RNA-binding protein Rrp42 (RNase PH superfamily)
VKEGSSAWKVNIHCMVVNHDGNVVDGCILGIMTALKDLRLPMVTIVSQNKQDVVKLLPPTAASGAVKDGNMDLDMDTSAASSSSDVKVSERKGTMLKFDKIAIPLTVALFQGKLLVDPTLEEENVSDGMITVVVDSMSVTQDKKTNALDGTILSLTKSGGGAMISIEETAACVQLAFGRAMELTSIMHS